MKAKFSRSYKKNTGNTVFVYTVTGSPEDMEKFKAAQGENHRVDDKTGEVLWFTTRYAGPSANLIITQAGKVIADMSKYDQAASISAQYGGNFGAELAKAAAASILGEDTSTSVAVTASTPADLGKL